MNGHPVSVIPEMNLYAHWVNCNVWHSCYTTPTPLARAWYALYDRPENFQSGRGAKKRPVLLPSRESWISRERATEEKTSQFSESATGPRPVSLLIFHLCEIPPRLLSLPGIRNTDDDDGTGWTKRPSEGKRTFLVNCQLIHTFLPHLFCGYWWFVSETRLTNWPVKIWYQF